MIAQADRLYAGEPQGVELEGAACALDSTTVDLCLSLFPWAKFKPSRGGVKMHTLLALRGNCPALVVVAPAQVHDVKVLAEPASEPGPSTSWIAATWTLPNSTASIRRRRPFRPDRRPGRTLADVAPLYRRRGQIELFFRWIKQHLRIEAFYGTSPNAVKTQIWLAICTDVLVALARKRLGLSSSLYTILQILSVTLFEKTPILQALSLAPCVDSQPATDSQLCLQGF